MVYYEIKTIYDNEVGTMVPQVEEKDVLENRRVEISLTPQYDHQVPEYEDEEFIRIEGSEVTICETKDTDLNSAPTLTKVFNYIKNNYGVEL